MSPEADFIELLDDAEKNYPQKLLQRVVSDLILGQWTVSCAESLTGGLLSEALTRLAKSSNFFIGSVICYHPRIKVAAVGVDPAILSKFGVVSAAVAEAMAAGIAKRFNTRIGLATTGVAGPDTLNGAPVGTVFVGLSIDGKPKTQRLDLKGDRQEIRQAAVLQALRMLAESLSTSAAL